MRTRRPVKGPRQVPTDDTCSRTGKVAHRHYAAAKAAAKLLDRYSLNRNKELDPVEVYSCSVCGHFHCGRPDVTANRVKKRLAHRKDRPHAFGEEECDYCTSS